jgi:hypothetical protein
MFRMTGQRIRKFLTTPKRTPNDLGDSLRAIQADRRFARKLDQVGPDFFSVGKPVPYALFISGQKVDWHVTALNFVARLPKGREHAGSEVFTAAPR